MDRAALRMEAGNAGINETGKYVEWLESRLLQAHDVQEALIPVVDLVIKQRRRAARAEPRR
jgi:hypothetical protein